MGLGANQAESPFWLLGAWAAPSPTSYLWVFLCIENAPCSPPSLCPSESSSWHEAFLQSSLTVPASPSEHFAHSPSQNSTLPAHLMVCLHRREPPTACLPHAPVPSLLPGASVMNQGLWSKQMRERTDEDMCEQTKPPSTVPSYHSGKLISSFPERG